MAQISTSDLRMDGPDPSVVALRALVAVSPRLDPTIEIVACIPCFRRPQYLRRTLESLGAQRTHRRFAVVMVENDASRSESVPVAAESLASGKFVGLCVIEPRQGNCHAINAAFETALQMFPAAASLLMIDDDEIASPDWLEQMVRTASATGADIVGGPVFPEFEDERKRGLRRHPAFAPAYDASGPVPVIYGCGNCLIRRSVFTRLGMPAFDLRFNFLGGGDTDFFYRCMRLGLRFHWVAEAVISETVPQSRTSLKWLVTGDLQIGDVGTGNELATYAVFGALSVLTVALAMRNDARGLATLLSPAFVLFAAWLMVTVVLSFDPGTSIKRLSLTMCVVAVTAALMLLPKSQQELMRWFTIAALALLAISYLGCLLAPDVSVHLATDPQEPGLAGNWRGAFGHKNQAAAIMVMVRFLGVYIIRSGLWICGVAIIALASLFLLYSAGKSSLTLCFAVLLLTSVTSVIRSFWLRAIILLTPLVLLNLLSVGTVMLEG